MRLHLIFALSFTAAYAAPIARITRSEASTQVQSLTASPAQVRDADPGLDGDGSGDIARRAGGNKGGSPNSGNQAAPAQGGANNGNGNGNGGGKQSGNAAPPTASGQGSPNGGGKGQGGNGAQPPATSSTPSGNQNAANGRGGGKQGGGNAAQPPAASLAPANQGAANGRGGQQGGNQGNKQGNNQGNNQNQGKSGAQGQGGGSSSSSSSASDAQAAQAWQSDTGTVSSFLNNAASLKGTQFTQAAQKALTAEKDELTHKAVLDADPKVKGQAGIAAANDALATQGNFQDVVDLLQDMVSKGDSVAVKDTNAINANRCKNVLPNIDVYLKAAGTNLQAVRPTAC